MGCPIAFYSWEVEFLFDQCVCSLHFLYSSFANDVLLQGCYIFGSLDGVDWVTSEVLLDSVTPLFLLFACWFSICKE